MTKTYRGRSEEEQKEFDKMRREEIRAAREKKKKGELLTDIDTATLSDIAANIQVEDVSIPKLSLKDRLLSKFTEQSEEIPKTKSAKEHVDKSDRLITGVMPLTISALLSIYAQRLFSEEYKACAPSKEEVSQIVLPIFSIISRSVAIEGKASQNAIDLGAAILASITMGTRMLMTSEEIRRNAAAASNRAEQNSRADNSPANVTALRSATSQNAAEQRRGSEYASGNGNGDGTASAYADEYSEAAIVAELFRRDTVGRRAMGYAPRNVRAAD